MEKLKSKFGLSTKTKSKVGGASEENEISEINKFYMHFKKALNSVLQPGHRFRPTSRANKGKPDTTVYEENDLVAYIKKHNQNISGNFHEALDNMANTYEKIKDFKSDRDKLLRTDLFDPIERSVLVDLKKISKLKKDVTDIESEVTSARKSTQKNPEDELAKAKLQRAENNLTDAKEKLQKEISSFKSAEVTRINMFIQAAEIQQEFYKNSANAFSELVDKLNTIKERQSDITSYDNIHFNGSKSGYLDSPEEGFGYTMTIKEYSTPKNEYKKPDGNDKCRAIYDFTAEADDDLSLQKGDEPTILEKVDNQWYYGELNGKKGHFPVDFVEKI